MYSLQCSVVVCCMHVCIYIVHTKSPLGIIPNSGSKILQTRDSRREMRRELKARWPRTKVSSQSDLNIHFFNNGPTFGIQVRVRNGFHRGRIEKILLTWLTRGLDFFTSDLGEILSSLARTESSLQKISSFQDWWTEGARGGKSLILTAFVRKIGSPGLPVLEPFALRRPVELTWSHHGLTRPHFARLPKSYSVLQNWCQVKFWFWFISSSLQSCAFRRVCTAKVFDRFVLSSIVTC